MYIFVRKAIKASTGEIIAHSHESEQTHETHSVQIVSGSTAG